MTTETEIKHLLDGAVRTAYKKGVKEGQGRPGLRPSELWNQSIMKGQLVSLNEQLGALLSRLTMSSSGFKDDLARAMTQGEFISRVNRQTTDQPFTSRPLPLVHDSSKRRRV